MLTQQQAYVEQLIGKKRVDIDKLMDDTQEDGSVPLKLLILIYVLVQSVT